MKERDLGIGRELFEARQSQGLKVDEVATRAHVNKGTISRVEQGKQASELSTVIKIIKALYPDIDDPGTQDLLNGVLDMAGLSDLEIRRRRS